MGSTHNAEKCSEPPSIVSLVVDLILVGLFGVKMYYFGTPSKAQKLFCALLL